MLPRRHRLTASREFARSVRQGRRGSSATVVTHVLQTGMDTPPRIGFVVSKAVGGAVVRNRVTRRLRHLGAARVDTLPGGAAVVVRALPAAAEATYAGLAADLDRALRRSCRPSAAQPGIPAESEQ